MGQEIAPVGGKKLPRKEVKNYVEEKINAIAAARAMPSLLKTPEEFDERRRLLLDQADALRKKAKASV
jgi:hypothetical protein